MTPEQIEQKNQLLKQKLEEANALRNELQAAGACPLNEDDLDQVAGGFTEKYEPHLPFVTPRHA